MSTATLTHAAGHSVSLQQILNALSTNATTVDAITELIYPYLLPDLVAMARESVLAHLQKLEVEGRVAHDGDRWRLL